MKIYFYLTILIFFQNNIDKKSIYEGSKLIGKRAYVASLDDDKIIVEYGGTSMKLGGKYFLLYKKNIQTKNIYIVAESEDKKTIIYKENNCLYLTLATNNDKISFKLKNKNYSPEIDKIRFNIFKMYFYNKYKGNYNTKENQDDFEKFKISPYKFLNLK